MKWWRSCLYSSGQQPQISDYLNIPVAKPHVKRNFGALALGFMTLAPGIRRTEPKKSRKKENVGSGLKGIPPPRAHPWTIPRARDIDYAYAPGPAGGALGAFAGARRPSTIAWHALTRPSARNAQQSALVTQELTTIATCGQSPRVAVLRDQCELFLKIVLDNRCAPGVKS